MDQDKLKTVFASVLGVDKGTINGDTSPGNTPAWDSMNAIILITEIEKAFGIRFNYDEAMGVKNFTDVLNLVKSKQENLNQ